MYKYLLSCALIFSVSVLFTGYAQTTIQQTKQNGSVSGKVTDGAGNPLPYASIVVSGSKIAKSLTLGDGSFIISQLSAGSYELTITYLGYTTYKQTVSVNNNNNTVNAKLTENSNSLNEVTVYGSLTRGQAKALNEQKNSVNIRNVVDYEQFSRFPDRNAAEALQRVPGIAISRDQGEGEYVTIRGLGPQFNAIQLNGQRIPSPDKDDGRGVGLGMLQAEMMQSISVNKTLTPDQDGDAIGGSVNFRLKEAPENAMLDLRVIGGINDQASKFNNLGQDLQQYSVNAGKRFFNNRLGILASGSYYLTNRGSLLNQYTFVNDTSINLSQKRWNDYDVNRQRYGLILSPDFRINAKNSIRLIYNMNRFDDDEIRRKSDFNIAGTINQANETRNRIEKISVDLFQLEGKHDLNGLKLDYNLSRIEGNMDELDASTYRYRRTMNYSAFNNDQIHEFTGETIFTNTSPLVLDNISVGNERTRDKDLSAKLNLNMPFSMFGHNNILSFGGKALDKNRSFFITTDKGTVDKTSPAASINQGNYGLLGIKSQNEGVPASAYAPDNAALQSNYNAEEKLYAGYLMGTFNLSDKLSAITGVRYEYTKNSYFHEVTKREGKSDYHNLLPSINLVYRPVLKTNIKLAYGMGINRPNYSALVPRYQQSVPNFTVTMGNPDLKPVEAHSFDLLFERYTGSLGLLSGGVFAKFLQNEIFTSQYIQNIGADPYIFTQPVNGNDSKVYGFETAINYKFDKLKSKFFKWFGVYANYTFTHSETNIISQSANRTTGVVTKTNRDISLSNSPKHVANLSLLYDNSAKGLSFTVTSIYRSEFLAAVGGNELNDFYYGHEMYLDFSASKRVYKNLTVFTQLNNLSNQKEIENLGKESSKFKRIQQTVAFGPTFSLGLTYKLSK